VLIETNEGDTPRIVVSAFSKSWTDPRRGTVPVSWSIDPALGEQFPALFDYFASTAGVNDSFVSGPGGCGYVYYGRMSDSQITAFATRCGRLLKSYGAAVVDAWGQTGLDPALNATQAEKQANSDRVLALFSKAAAAGGVAPQMYISQPTPNIGYAYYPCEGVDAENKGKNMDNQWLKDGTPVVCTNAGKSAKGQSENVFYIPGTCFSCCCSCGCSCCCSRCCCSC